MRSALCPSWPPGTSLPWIGCGSAATRVRHDRLEGAAHPRRQHGQQGGVAGSTLYLPVWVPGANFPVGDGHGVGGGGASRPLLRQPKAHFISMGLNEDLDQAMKQALREMISFICSRSNLSREPLRVVRFRAA